MKKFFTLLFSSLFSLSLLAYDGGRLSISTVNANNELKVELDGRRLNMQNNSITLSNLEEGSHQLKIYREKSIPGNGADKHLDIIYSNSIYLKKGFHSDITVNRFGKVFIDEHYIDHFDKWYNEKDADDHIGKNDGNGGGWNNGYVNVMSSREFNDVKDQVRKEWFENNRLICVKTIIDKSHFTVQQVKELMWLFAFENNRLEIAKYAYCKTADKNNYYQLNDALAFSSKMDELACYIREAH